MRVEELGRDDTASPNKLANEIFTRARQNVSDLLRGETSHEGEVDRERSGRSRAVQIRDHFNRGELDVLVGTTSIGVSWWLLYLLEYCFMCFVLVKVMFNSTNFTYIIV